MNERERAMFLAFTAAMDTEVSSSKARACIVLRMLVFG
jgi:hypothetical protein